MTKLDRLLTQGTWLACEIDGQNVPYFKMPDATLQKELQSALDTYIKKTLKAGGWRKVHATEYEHPFYTDLLRERMNALAEQMSVPKPNGQWGDCRFDPELLTEEGAAKAVRSRVRERFKIGGEVIKTSKVAAEVYVARDVKEAKACWSAAVNKWRSMIADPKFYDGTYVQRALAPNGEPKFTDKPPKPVYTNKANPTLIVSLEHTPGWVDLWERAAPS